MNHFYIDLSVFVNRNAFFPENIYVIKQKELAIFSNFLLTSLNIYLPQVPETAIQIGYEIGVFHI